MMDRPDQTAGPAGVLELEPKEEGGEIVEEAGGVTRMVAPVGAGVTGTGIGAEALQGPVEEIFLETGGEVAVVGAVGVVVRTDVADMEAGTKEEGEDTEDAVLEERMLRSRSCSNRAEMRQVSRLIASSLSFRLDPSA